MTSLIDTNRLRELIKLPGYLSGSVEKAIIDAANEIDALRAALAPGSFVEVWCPACPHSAYTGEILARLCTHCKNKRVVLAEIAPDLKAPLD